MLLRFKLLKGTNFLCTFVTVLLHSEILPESDEAIFFGADLSATQENIAASISRMDKETAFTRRTNLESGVHGLKIENLLSNARVETFIFFFLRVGILFVLFHLDQMKIILMNLS